MPGRQRIDDLTTLAVPEQPALLAGRRRVAYVLRTYDADEPIGRRALWRVGARTASRHQLTRGPADLSPTWSPDGSLSPSSAQKRAGAGLAATGRGGEPER